MDAELDQVFPHVEVLAAGPRLALSELLAGEGRPPALLADEIASLALPSDPGARDAMRPIIESGLVPGALAQVGELRLGELVPPISGRNSGFDGALPTRLGELLRANGVSTWSGLGALTVGELSAWGNVGPRTLATLVGIAVDAGLGFLGEHCVSTVEAIGPPALVAGASDVVVLLDYEQATGSGTVRGALESYARGDAPPDVRHAAARLLGAASQLVHPALAMLDQVWAAAGDHRDRVVLDRRALRLGERCPTRKLAQAVGVSETSVRGIEARAVERAHLAARREPAALRELTFEVAQVLGPVCTHADVGRLLAERRLPAVPDPRSLLLLWLAGPYLVVAGHPTWLATDPGALVADTRRLLGEDGGVRALDQVAAELGDAGIAAGDVGTWLAEQPVVVVDGLVVVRSGTPADVAERVLSAAGRAMTAAQLWTAASGDTATGAGPTAGGAGPTAAAKGSRNTLAGLESRLLADRRFVRVSREQFELAEWGTEAWSDPDATAPQMFTPPGRARPAATAWLRIEIDQAVLSGSSGPVPLPLVEDLGVGPGAHRTFATRYGPVALSHKAAQPTRGSVRPVALAAGAGAGDILMLGFDAMAGNAAVELVAAT